jgi:hypothetical protein
MFFLANFLMLDGAPNIGIKISYILVFAKHGKIS